MPNKNVSDKTDPVPPHHVAKIWQVGVVGLSPVGLFQLETLSLCDEVHLAGAYDASPQRRSLVAGSSFPLWDQPPSQSARNEVEALFLVDDISAEAVTSALQAGQHVVLHRPWCFSAAELRKLDQQAASTRRLATIATLRRGSADFLAAMGAMGTGRLGTLHSVMLSVQEKRVPQETSEVRVLREFGYHHLDQLRILNPSPPQRVFGKRSGRSNSASADGFLAIVEFANGCTARIEINLASRLGSRTGWVLEGATGSFRGDRLFTETADGEIVDEPIEKPPFPAESLIGQLVTAWRGEPTTLPTLADAAEVVQLIEALEQSLVSGEVVRM